MTDEMNGDPPMDRDLDLNNPEDIQMMSNQVTDEVSGTNSLSRELQ